jgi:hypothetical protein
LVVALVALLIIQALTPLVVTAVQAAVVQVTTVHNPAVQEHLDKVMQVAQVPI